MSAHSSCGRLAKQSSLLLGDGLGPCGPHPKSLGSEHCPGAPCRASCATVFPFVTSGSGLQASSLSLGNLFASSYQT